MSKISMHCFVRGKVQGVFFRKYTKEQAKRLGVKGWVKNLSDGRVEVLASGESDAVEELIAWLHQGPPSSHVDSVVTASVSFQPFEDFHIEHS